VAGKDPDFSKLTEKQEELIKDMSKQIDQVRHAMKTSADLEQQHNEAIRKGNLQEAQSLKFRAQNTKKIIKENSILAGLLEKENELREKAASEAQAEIDAAEKRAKERADIDRENAATLFAVGKEGTTLGDTMRSLDANFNIMADQTGLMGKIMAKLNNSNLKMAVSFGSSAALIGSVANKYANTLLESATYLPESIQKAGLGGATMQLGKMMATSGLQLEQLTSAMKENQVAWNDSGKEITEFVGSNEKLRKKLGMTREGFAEATARATNFLKSTGTQQKDLNKETRNYMINLNKVAVQTGRQASEIEENRREAAKDASSFLAEVGGPARKAFIGMFYKLADQAKKSNPIAEQIKKVFAEGDMSSRKIMAAQQQRSMRLLAKRAGVSDKIMDEFFKTQDQAINGNKDAAAKLAKMSKAIGGQINDFVVHGGKLRKKGEIAFDDTQKEMEKTAMQAGALTNSMGATQQQMNKAGNRAAKMMDDSIKTPLEDVTTAISRLRALLGAVGGDFATLAGGFLAGLPGILQVMKAFPKFGGLFGKFTKRFKKSEKLAGENVTGMVGKFGKFGGFLGKFLKFLGPLGLAAGVVVPLIIDNWDTISKYLGKFAPMFTGIYDKIVKVVNSIFPGTTQWISSLFAGMTNSWDSGTFFNDYVIAPVSNFFSGMMKSVDGGTFFNDYIATPIANYITWMFKTYKKGFNLLDDYVITPVVGFFKKQFTEDNLKSAGQMLLHGVTDAFSVLLKILKSVLDPKGWIKIARSILPSAAANWIFGKEKKAPAKAAVAKPVTTTADLKSQYMFGQAQYKKMMSDTKMPKAAIAAMAKTLAAEQAVLEKRGVNMTVGNPTAIQTSAGQATVGSTPTANTPSVLNNADAMKRLTALQLDMSANQAKQADLQKKVNAGTATDVDKKSLQDVGADIHMQKAILEQLKELVAATKTSVKLQDSINTSNTKIARKSN